MKRGKKAAVSTLAKARLLKVMEYAKLDPLEFSKKLGVPYSRISCTLQDYTVIHSQVRQRILSTYKEISENWLITGDGDMLGGLNPNKRLLKALNETFLVDLSSNNEEELSTVASRIGIGTVRLLNIINNTSRIGTLQVATPFAKFFKVQVEDILDENLDNELPVNMEVRDEIMSQALSQANSEKEKAEEKEKVEEETEIPEGVREFLDELRNNEAPLSFESEEELNKAPKYSNPVYKVLKPFIDEKGSLNNFSKSLGISGSHLAHIMRTTDRKLGVLVATTISKATGVDLSEYTEFNTKLPTDLDSFSEKDRVNIVHKKYNRDPSLLLIEILSAYTGMSFTEFHRKAGVSSSTLYSYRFSSSMLSVKRLLKYGLSILGAEDDSELKFDPVDKELELANTYYYLRDNTELFSKYPTHDNESGKCGLLDALVNRLNYNQMYKGVQLNQNEILRLSESENFFVITKEIYVSSELKSSVCMVKVPCKIIKDKIKISEFIGDRIKESNLIVNKNQILEKYEKLRMKYLEALKTEFSEDELNLITTESKETF